MSKYFLFLCLTNPLFLNFVFQGGKEVLLQAGGVDSLLSVLNYGSLVTLQYVIPALKGLGR
jgi:hypothetical protein